MDDDPIREMLLALLDDGYGINKQAYTILKDWVGETNKDIFDEVYEVNGRYFYNEGVIKK